MPAFQLGLLIHHGQPGALLGKVQQQLAADLGVSHLAAAEADRDLDPIAFAQKLLSVAQFGIEISIPGDIRTSLISTTC